MNKVYLLKEHDLKKDLSNKSLESILNEKEIKFEDLVVSKTKKNKNINIKKLIKKLNLVKWLVFPTVDSARVFRKLMKENKKLQKLFKKKKFNILAKELVVGIYLKKHGIESDIIPLRPATFMVGEILPWSEDEIILFDPRYWQELEVKNVYNLTKSILNKKVLTKFNNKDAAVLATSKRLLENLYKITKIKEETVVYCLNAYIAEVCWANGHDKVEIPDEYTQMELVNKLISK